MVLACSGLANGRVMLCLTGSPGMLVKAASAEKRVWRYPRCIGWDPWRTEVGTRSAVNAVRPRDSACRMSCLCKRVFVEGCLVKRAVVAWPVGSIPMKESLVAWANSRLRWRLAKNGRGALSGARVLAAVSHPRRTPAA